MLLSDQEIIQAQDDGELTLRPFDESCLNPASIDLRLSQLYRVPNWICRHIDVAAVQPDHTTLLDAGAEGSIVLKPGEQMLACTQEYLELGPTIAARVEGKSSLARLFLPVHITGGFIDPGFRGQVTLEIVNLAQWEITLHVGMKIAQAAFHFMSAPPVRDYSVTGRYLDQAGPTESRYSLS